MKNDFIYIYTCMYITSQPEKQTIAIYTLLIISRSKGSQTMKYGQYGQLIEYNMRNIFLKNHTQNVVEKPFPEPFLKNQNWVYLWVNSLRFYKVWFYWMPSEGYQNILKLNCRPLAFTSWKTFQKTKKTWN